MALSPELTGFCSSWKQKADSYTVADARGAFDRFFTLHVVFNRLYAEATFRLARQSRVRIRNHFPDSKGAQDYLLQFCGASRLLDALDANPETRAALSAIISYLRQGRFAIKLHMITGDQQPTKDRELLTRMESHNQNERALAVLEVLYVIRCNMFHGHKGFQPVQLELLRPAITLLEKTIEVTYESLQNDGG